MIPTYWIYSQKSYWRQVLETIDGVKPRKNPNCSGSEVTVQGQPSGFNLGLQNIRGINVTLDLFYRSPELIERCLVILVIHCVSNVTSDFLASLFVHAGPIKVSSSGST